MSPHGDERAVRAALEARLAMGFGELLVQPIGAGADPASAAERAVRLAGAIATG